MDPIEEFKLERASAISQMSKDEEFKKMSLEWMLHADKYKYSYNYRWLGRPIIKYPNDIIAMQELIWNIKPDLIIETGIAHGGSIIFSASILELIGKGEVFAIDINIRPHNKKEITNHPLYKRITMVEGSSLDPKIFEQVKIISKEKKTVIVILDSLHTHPHVIKELELYSSLVSVGSYLICPDTFIEFFPKGYFSNRPWDVGNNTYTAIKEFLKNTDDFEVDYEIGNKLMITEGFDGYLKRVK